MEKKEKKGFFKEFKEFITRGNVLDLAVGIIIGGAFTAIVTALTSGILQPLINWIIGLIIPGDGLNAARTVLGNYVGTDGAQYAYTSLMPAGVAVDWSATNYIDWGAFISAIINFLLVALVLFLIVKAINKAREASEKAKEKLAKNKDEEEANAEAEEEKKE